MADTLIYLDNTRKMSARFSQLENNLYICGFAIAKLIKLAKMAGVLHEAGHACSMRRIW